MSRLGVKGKILLLLSLFILPLGLLGYGYLQEIADERETILSELDGARLIRHEFRALFKGISLEGVLSGQKRISKIANESKLILDSHYDSYFIQNILTNGILETTEHIVRGASTEDETERLKNKGSLELHILPKLFRDINEAKVHLKDEGKLGESPIEKISDLLDRQTQISATALNAIDKGMSYRDEGLKELSSIAEELSLDLEKILTARAAIWVQKERWAYGITLATLASLIFLSFGIIKNITHRLSLLFNATKRAASDGDLSQEIHTEGSDEIYRLSSSFNGMLSSLRGMVQKIVHSGSLIGTSTSEIAAVSKQQQATTSEIAATTTQIEATSKQIAATSQELSKSMQEVQEIASETSTLASEGQTSLEQMGKTMQGITDACEGISQKLETLNQRASKIGDVVVTIAKVADQTNLLSLNAAIEAEKAGEYGHGFAVVAREIRRLADQTAASTIDIEQMVKEIQAAVAAGVMGMEKFANEVRRGAGEVESTSSQFTTIIGQIQTLNPTFQSVAEGMQSQALGAKQITESLSQLSTAARQTADSLSQSNVSIDQLHQATVLLKQEVQRFQLGGNY